MKQQPAAAAPQVAPSLDAANLVSKADLKGRITYVNQAFLQSSGYAEAELLGMPYSVVPHPDMPKPDGSATHPSRSLKCASPNYWPSPCSWR